MKNICAILTLFVLFFYSCNNDPIETLQEGIETQDLEKIKRALNDIPDGNILLQDGNTALTKAIEKDNIEMVQVLLDKGAEINPTNRNVPICSATSADMIEFLIKKGASVNAQDSLGNSILHGSTSSKITKILLEQKADVNQQNKEGETPLMKIAAAGNKDLFTLLLEHGADTEIKDKKGKTAINQILPSSDLATYWQEKQERKALEAEKKKQAEVEKRKKLALKNAFPTKGKIGYICNYGTDCQVLIKEVAGGKVKIEVLEKCWPKSMNTANLSKALDPGNVRWLNKSRVRKNRGTCY